MASQLLVYLIPQSAPWFLVYCYNNSGPVLFTVFSGATGATCGNLYGLLLLENYKAHYEPEHTM